MKQTEQEKRNAVYDTMNVSEELRQKAENFASSGKTKTERNITIENTDSPDVIRRKGTSRTKRAFKTMRKNKKAKTIKLNKIINYCLMLFKR